MEEGGLLQTESSYPDFESNPFSGKYWQAGENADPSAKAYEAWGKVLDDCVEDGLIHFNRLQKNPSDLNTWIEYIAENKPPKIDPQKPETKDAALAFYLNAFCGLGINSLIDHYKKPPEDEQRKQGMFQKEQKWDERLTKNPETIFNEYEVRFAGRSTTLHDLEREIRSTFKDIRINFALCYGTYDYAPPPKAPFAADRLDKQLDWSAKKFFDDSRYFRADYQEKKLYISDIVLSRRERFLKYYQDKYGIRTDNLLAALQPWMGPPARRTLASAISFSIEPIAPRPDLIRPTDPFAGRLHLQLGRRKS
jgi:hypothetical protein